MQVRCDPPAEVSAGCTLSSAVLLPQCFSQEDVDAAFICQGSTVVAKRTTLPHTSLQKYLWTWDHSDVVTSSAVSPKGQTLAFGDMSGRVTVLDTKSGQLVKGEGVTPKPCLLVTCISFSSDGRWLAHGSVDGSVVIESATTGKQVVCVAAGSHMESTASNSDKTLAEERNLPVSGTVRHCSFSPDNTKLVCCGEREAVDVYCIEEKNGEMNVTSREGQSREVPWSRMKGHDAWVLWASFSDDSGKLASIDAAGEIFIWELARARRAAKSRPHAGPGILVRFLSSKRDGTKAEAVEHLISASLDGSVIISELAGQRGRKSLVQLTRLDIHAIKFAHVLEDMDEGGLRMLTCGVDQRVMLTSFDSHTRRLWRLGGWAGGFNAVSVSPSGARIATLVGGSAEVWLFLVPSVSGSAPGLPGNLGSGSTDGHREVSALLSGGGTGYALCVTLAEEDDRSMVAAGLSDGHVALWDLPKERLLRRSHSCIGGQAISVPGVSFRDSPQQAWKGETTQLPEVLTPQKWWRPGCDSTTGQAVKGCAFCGEADRLIVTCDILGRFVITCVEDLLPIAEITTGGPLSITAWVMVYADYCTGSSQESQPDSGAVAPGKGSIRVMGKGKGRCRGRQKKAELSSGGEVTLLSGGLLIGHSQGRLLAWQVASGKLRDRTALPAEPNTVVCLHAAPTVSLMPQTQEGPKVCPVMVVFGTASGLLYLWNAGVGKAGNGPSQVPVIAIGYAPKKAGVPAGIRVDTLRRLVVAWGEGFVGIWRVLESPSPSPTTKEIEVERGEGRKEVDEERKNEEDPDGSATALPEPVLMVYTGGGDSGVGSGGTVAVARLITADGGGVELLIVRKDGWVEVVSVPDVA